MKPLLIVILYIVISPIYSQVYTQKDFKLSNNVKKMTVLTYDLYEENGDIVESFPMSEQTTYKTDLNLIYLEFNIDETLKKSKLFYPRDFNGQFSLLEPYLDLESSDFGEKINYSTKSYRYDYIKDDEILKLTITNENNTKINILLKDGFLLEDEYYFYTIYENNLIKTLTKKRKGSNYGFRRIEEVSINENIIRKEFINNRFLVAKDILRESEYRVDKIKVTQSRIQLDKLEYNKFNQLINYYYVNLSWRNKFKKWPDIDFDENYNYDSYLLNLERVFQQTLIEYKYDTSNNIINKNTYLIQGSKKDLIMVEDFFYDDESRLLLHKVNDNYKEYQYDDYGNWTIKILGTMTEKDNVKVPYKKYNRTFTYWN